MPKLTVIVLCADWCHVCTGFAPALGELARRRADTRFEWVDIEEEDEALEGVDVEDFPTLAVFLDGALAHFGAVRAEPAAVERLIDALAAKALSSGAAVGDAGMQRGDLLALLRCQAGRPVRGA